ncbi:Putative peroxiredoxin bcp [Streptomyces hundungensis]|uniref:thioredoxin-dependent peroxiredoxin n=1 Tax=Streptomyces hundungensis TaxID=1077946 RepID=A0A387HB91_9ACTN|nr:peroxiredoxin [Streptomyces hundungensis]AYG78230.1 Putative peroxiredoxin bcp [Streptomyces hundungensis]
MASVPAPGQPPPDFALPGGILTEGSFVRGEYWLRAERNRPLVLAFYPGDDTPVCTRQLCSYSSGLEAFAQCGADVWAISPQSLDSHETFARKHQLAMPLLADTERVVARSYGITAPGIGLRRSVFLIAPDGTLSWKHVTLLGATFPSVDTLTQQLSLLQEER